MCLATRQLSYINDNDDDNDCLLVKNIRGMVAGSRRRRTRKLCIKTSVCTINRACIYLGMNLVFRFEDLTSDQLIITT